MSSILSKKWFIFLVIFVIFVLLFLGVAPLFSPFEASVTIDDGSDGDTTTTTTTTTGTSGGSGGTSPTPIADFSIDKILFEVQLFPGETKTETVTIENIGDVELNFILDVINIEQFITLSNYSFTLMSGDIKVIDIDFSVDEEEIAGVYTGRIDLITGQLNKSINIVLQVLEKEALFDLESELEDETLTKAQKIEVTITMTDVSDIGKVNVLLEYFIKDFSENETEITQEEVEVSEFLKIERAFSIPETLKTEEEYVFYVKLTSQNSVATSANTFRLIDVIRIYNLLLYTLVLMIVFVLLVWIFLPGKRRREGEKKVKKGKRFVILKEAEKED